MKSQPGGQPGAWHFTTNEYSEACWIAHMRDVRGILVNGVIPATWNRLAHQHRLIDRIQRAGATSGGQAPAITGILTPTASSALKW